MKFLPQAFRQTLRLRDLDLQSKVTLVLLAVIVPAFLIVAVAGSALTRPWLENEVRQIATGVGQAFALEITGSKWLIQDELNPRVERRIRELVYQQPSIVRLDVLTAGELSQGPWAPIQVVGSSMEQDSAEQPPLRELSVGSTARIISDDDGERFWEIVLPVFSSASAYSSAGSDYQKSARKLIGNIYILGSLGFVERLHGLIWKSTGIGAFLALLTLFVTLRYFLRRTIENEKRLTLVESRNLQLTEKLHETQRELMNKEKLAVMGQLTASFAHEIGTPLNAMGGHLQLLELEVEEPKSRSRISVIRSQLEKIESIVKGFLQNTARAPSQRQWVDLNALVDKTLCFVAPRAEALGVTVRRELDRNLGPVRAVPLEMEQILLNLVNNSLDALESKREQSSRKSLVLQVRSLPISECAEPRVELEVYDTGEGISQKDLKEIFKPFFTTKPAGQGTGLGLTISQELAASNGASLHLSSKKGSWTRATLQVPYA